MQHTHKQQDENTNSASESKQRGLWEEMWRNFKKNRLSVVGGFIVAIYIFIAIFAPLLAPTDPITQYNAPEGERNPLPLMSTSEEGHLFLLGSDKFGRDILARSIYGTRTLLKLAVGAVLIAMLLGIFMGAISGYWKGKWIDELIMRIADVMLSFPTLVLAIALLGAFGIGKMTVAGIEITNIFKIMIVIAITYAPRFARVMRGVVLQEASEDYVEAAKVSGASAFHIITKEIFINTIPPIMVQASLMMATTVLTSSSLSFLGLGLQPPEPSLGIMLNESRDFLLSGAWWYAVIPGIFISLAILGFNLLGDGLRDTLDPKQAKKV